MSTTKPVITVKDSTTFTLNEADLTGKKIGEFILTPKRNVPCSDGLQWWIDYGPAGDRETAKGHLSVFLWVNKPVTAKYSFAVDGTSISLTDTHEFTYASLGIGSSQYASHKRLAPLFRNGKLTVTCSVELDILAPAVSIPRNFHLFDSVSTDVEFVMGSEIVPAHKSFLALISPVFRAMFAHNTASKSGSIKIAEFDYATVKAAIDICYGRELKELSVETATSILRFCDKYFITAVINELEKLPLLIPSVETFCPIVHYAYDCNKDALLVDCYKFFKEHQDEIKVTNKFAELPPTLVVDMLKAAFDLETDYGVLRHAHKNDIGLVLNHLEQPLIDSMTLEDFCPAVNFAWDCSREDLKQACGKYLNDNRDEILSLNTFYRLPSKTIGNLLKTSHTIK